MKVALVNPVSSGNSLISAFEDFGCGILSISSDGISLPDGTSYQHRSFDETLNHLRAASVNHVLAGSEYGIALAEQLAHALELPTNDMSIQEARLNKFSMFERLKSEGVQVAPFYSVAHESQLDELIRAGLKYPIFIKPKASAGTDGCLRCENHVDLTNAFLKISKQRNLLNRINSEVLVQEYIRGTQYIVNTVSLGGHHLPCEVYRVRIDEIDGIPVYRSIVACDIDYTDATIQQAVAYVETCLNSLGICNGAAHTELRMTENGPSLIEVNSRIMGPALYVDAFFNAFGYSQSSLLAESCVHPERFKRRFVLPKKMKKHFAMVYLRTAKAAVELQADPAWRSSVACQLFTVS
jgi:predicted ATP-grasp superfamily ATP-dependent carboligase